MAFSIFNKPGQDGKSPSTDATKTSVKAPGRETAVSKPTESSGPSTAFPPTATAPGASSVTSRPVGQKSAPEMMAYDVEELPLLQEIAVLYAADHLDTAQALLKKLVMDKTSTPQPWLMLLDLYKLRNFKKEFEDLAMTYTVKFERSPPTWNQQIDQREVRKDARPASDFFILQPKDDLLPEIAKLVEFVSRLGSIRIDFGKMKNIKPGEAEALAKGLVDARKQKQTVRFNNINPFIDLLKKIISENPSKEFAGIWVLIFELYQRQGMQSEFEDLGLEYAMGFEMSPPSWEAGAAPPPQGAGAEAEQAAAGEPEPPATQGFALRGSISVDNITQLQQLMNHAAAHKEVHINLAELQRIEFAATGILIDALTKITAAGKKIVLVDVSELVFPLLEAFGANRLAVLLRRKAQ